MSFAETDAERRERLHRRAMTPRELLEYRVSKGEITEGEAGFIKKRDAENRRKRRENGGRGCE
jgi:hypothetical protein